MIHLRAMEHVLFNGIFFSVHKNNSSTETTVEIQYDSSKTTGLSLLHKSSQLKVIFVVYFSAV